MRKLFITLVVCFVAWTSSRAQDTLESRMSPKLRQFMRDHPAALNLLVSSFSEVFSNRTVLFYYFYSGDSEARAYHFYPNTVDLPQVVLCVRENQEPIDEFICLCFETANSKGEKRFEAITGEARTGRISKADFAKEILRVEFDAIKCTRDLLMTIKFNRKEVETSHFYQKFVECPSQFEEFLSYTKGMHGKRDALKEYEAKYDSLQQKP